MKILFSILLILHGLIHSMGFVKAFNLGKIDQLSQEISRFHGALWLLATFLFVITTALYLLNFDKWWLAGVFAVAVSQILIFIFWQDAKFGTIANVLILLVAVFGWGSHNFEKNFRNDVAENLARSATIAGELLTEADLQHLPEVVQRYIRYSGALNKPKVNNMKIVFEGEMRSKGKDYFPFVSEQYNFFDEPTRLFFMKGKMFGIQVPGYHRYIQAKATMDIRLFGLFPVIRQAGGVMDTTETVTLFNDMCLMAPSTLIDKRIQWQPLDENAVIARFTNHGITITAVLYFNSEGQLVDFASKDRTAISDMKRYPFFTPISGYKDFDGRKVPTYGEAIYQYPDGKFTYGKFSLKEITYNIN
jgi:hypothetical protein